MMIDGIDVSECIHYKECKNGNGRCLIFDEKCHRIGIDESNEDICYYKQLKRKEQALTEIEKIAKNNIERCNICQQEPIFIEELDCFEMICEYRPLRDCSKTILQIIQKVKEQ